MERSLHAIVTPASIPADAVELLRSLVLTPGTREKELEDWIFKYPQVIGASSNDLLPHPHIRLPGEPERYWKPDALFKATDSEYYDVVEFKRADMQLVSGSRGLSHWVPSGAPSASTKFNRAVGQLQMYLEKGIELKEYLESTHSIRLFFPRGIIIGGQEVDLSSQRDLRLLRYSLPSNIDLITWTGILRRADAMKAYRVIVSLPCAQTEEEHSGVFDCDVHRDVAAAFYDWTGFASPYADPLNNWRELLNIAEKTADKGAGAYDTDSNVGRSRYSSFRGSMFSPVYYRLGKYCVQRTHAEKVFKELPDTEEYLSRRSFKKKGERFWEGFEDTQKFLKIGSEATSVANLRTSIETLLHERRPGGKVPEDAIEPNSFYRRICTVGYLQKNLHDREIVELLRVGGWLAP